jgi:FkbM family methyltransferase
MKRTPWFLDRRYTAEEIVAAAYRGLLGRGADPDGLATYAGVIRKTNEVSTVLSELVTSAEFRMRSLSAGRFESFKPVCTLIDGDRLKLWVDLSDAFVSTAVLCGQYEPAETEFILSRLSPGDTFVDIGANLGWFTILAADKVGPNGRVFAFEPRSQTADLLERSIADNGFGDRCMVIRAALGDRPGSCHLLSRGGNNPGGSHLLPGGDGGLEGRTEVVDVVTLDSVMGGVGCGLVKMDVEGAEAMVLRGAAGFLQRCRPIILSEILPSGLRAVSGVTVGEYVELVRTLGYAVRAIEGFPASGALSTSALERAEMTNVVLAPAN